MSSSGSPTGDAHRFPVTQRLSIEVRRGSLLYCDLEALCE